LSFDKEDLSDVEGDQRDEMGGIARGTEIITRDQVTDRRIREEIPIGVNRIELVSGERFDAA
jgi:hypothetical protein